MNVVHVSPHLPPDQAANALLPAQLGRWMAERGDEIAFVAHEPGQEHAQPATGRLEPITWIPRRANGGWSRALRVDAWRLVRRVNAALDRVAARADLLHLHSNGLIIEAAAAWTRRRGVPYVLTLYGTEIWHYRRRRLVDPFTRAYSRAARVTFYSRGLLDHAKGVGLDRAGLSVVYPPVAPDFAPRDDAARADARRRLGVSEPRLLLNVKRLHPLAGQTFLIDAFAQACGGRRDVRLVICGDGAERARLERQAAERGVADRITFTGLLPNAAIAEYMACADLFVLPSRLEALPTVAVEALASGTPVLSADHPGGLELHAIFGADVAVVAKEQVQPLASAIGESLAHPRRTSAATAARIDELFRPAAVLGAFDAVYREAVGATARA